MSLSDWESDVTSLNSEDEDFKPKRKGRPPKAEYKIRNALRPPRTTSYTAKSLYDQIHDNTIDLDPPYQRDVVWTDVKQIGLIDSIIRNYYIPPIIFAVTYDSQGAETRVCIDGKQRLTSIRRFIDGEICHKDIETAKRYWYKQSTGARKPLLPKQYIHNFAMKQIVCVEYDALTEDQEREIFQRVQLGVALTPAERMQAIAGPWSSFIRELQSQTLGDDGFAESFEWDRARSRDFQCLASSVHLIHTYPNGKLPSSPQLDKMLSQQSSVPEKLRSDVKETFKIFVLLARNPKYNACFQKPVRVSPVEFIMMAVLIFCHRENLSMAQLSTAIGMMRADVRRTHADLRQNTKVLKTMWTFNKRLKPSAVQTDGKDGVVASVAVRGSSEASTKSTKRKRVNDDSDKEEQIRKASKPKATANSTKSRVTVKSTTVAGSKAHSSKQTAAKSATEEKKAIPSKSASGIPHTGSSSIQLPASIITSQHQSSRSPLPSTTARPIPRKIPTSSSSAPTPPPQHKPGPSSPFFSLRTIKADSDIQQCSASLLEGSTAGQDVSVDTSHDNGCPNLEQAPPHPQPAASILSTGLLPVELGARPSPVHLGPKVRPIPPPIKPIPYRAQARPLPTSPSQTVNLTPNTSQIDMTSIERVLVQHRNALARASPLQSPALATPASASGSVTTDPRPQARLHGVCSATISPNTPYYIPACVQAQSAIVSPRTTGDSTSQFPGREGSYGFPRSDSPHQSIGGDTGVKRESSSRSSSLSVLPESIKGSATRTPNQPPVRPIPTGPAAMVAARRTSYDMGPPQVDLSQVFSAENLDWPPSRASDTLPSRPPDPLSARLPEFLPSRPSDPLSSRLPDTLPSKPPLPNLPPPSTSYVASSMTAGSIVSSLDWGRQAGLGLPSASITSTVTPTSAPANVTEFSRRPPPSSPRASWSGRRSSNDYIENYDRRDNRDREYDDYDRRRDWDDGRGGWNRGRGRGRGRGGYRGRARGSGSAPWLYGRRSRDSPELGRDMDRDRDRDVRLDYDDSRDSISSSRTSTKRR